ncbi:MAG: Ribonucleoside-diphosphate reductase NrdZ [Microgenomates bacterium OLB22]|nr:MAG: Ribonucleoside-diphosphate reductase NrdZ [Microgenomates bacterium OLB22]
MQLSGISEKVFLDRYSLKDPKGAAVEKSPEEMWKRVAKAVSLIEKDKRKATKWEKAFYEAMTDFKYVPGGRILAGAGTGYEVTYYNCFVIPAPKDSRGGILETLRQMVEIMSHGGGVGFNLSSLRPRGMRVRKVNGFSSGPMNWAELFSVATRDIIQQGGSRRGALMLMMWDWHPDIEEFITVKQDLSRIQGANLSVCVSDSFMDAVKADGDWVLRFPDTTDPDYDEKWTGDIEAWEQLGKRSIVHKTVRAREIWDLIAEAAWKSAEPGVVFMERCNKLYNNWYWNKIHATNPCGEEPLPDYGVCNLGSVNLSALVKSESIDIPGEFDFEELKSVVHTAVRFQDNVIEMDPYIFDGIRKTQLEGERRIGLGTMGLGDALIKLHLRYGSPESLSFIDKVYRIIRDEAYAASVEIAKEKGSFAMFDGPLYTKGAFIKQLPGQLRRDIRKYGIRNSLLLMQAPTGSTSLMSNTTSGIEPVYEFEFLRRDRIGEHVIRHHLFDQWYELHSKEIEEGKIQRPAWFVGANDLTPEDHVRVQGAIQKYVDASISKTCNAPNAHTVEDVKKLYNLAYELGLKGVTYMRDGSREGVLSRIEEKKEAPAAEVVSQAVPVVPRPMIVQGSTYKIHTPVGTAYITVNQDDQGNPIELFLNIGKAGSDVAAMAEGLGRAISIMLRMTSTLSSEEKLEKIADELEYIGGGRVTGFGKSAVRSLPDAVAKAIRMYASTAGNHVAESDKVSLHNGNGSAINGTAKDALMVDQPLASLAQMPLFDQKRQTHFDICPECGEATLVYEEGCKKCYSCGMSAC